VTEERGVRRQASGVGRAFVIGHPVAHSKSPEMIDAAFAAMGIDAVMERLDVAPETLSDEIARLRASRMIGASVTVPHKVAVAALCDELSDAARAIGAVNCLELRGGLVGHNTDAPGFADALAAAGWQVEHAVLLGAGGAARAVAHALGAAQVEIIARRGALPWTDAQLRASFARADLVVDCTPTGLDATSDTAFAASLPLDALAPAARVATLVYHRRTALLERAASLGHATLDGRAMLVHQAARALTIWTGREPPLEIMTRALDASVVKSA
jgi:shikimate dehydrogenase